MNNRILFLLIICISFSCEEPEKQQKEVVKELINTLDQDDLGGKTGHILDYFTILIQM
jgi:hypothetical protein